MLFLALKAVVKLSVVIVNYNVKHFIEQCLFSVLKAAQHVSCEVFVVDNNSVDGSVALIKSRFPQITLIENTTNTGFSVANNQAIRQATGEYVLLLNPDTVVQEDTFLKTVAFMDEHPEAGGLGVKMLDGQGNFAPESKRGLPTPAVAFYKMFGLSKLFPRSRKFGRYHLTYLSEKEVQEIDVISGAFMLMRKAVLDRIGLLDETFFMYGEDIDLSYRITQAGYKNYYFPYTQIIHYKGESTKRSSINYVLVFYKAMAIFSKKHFSGSHTFWFSFLINLAIVLKAGAALLGRFFKAFTLPLIDFVWLTAGLFVIKDLYLSNTGLSVDVYSQKLLMVAFPAYAIAWILMVYFNGGYDKPVKLLKIARGIVLGTVLILLAYSLLPESLRFSRAFILFGTGWAFVSFVALRVALHLLKFRHYSLSSASQKRIAIAGNAAEFTRVSALLKETRINAAFVGFVNTGQSELPGVQSIGSMAQIDEVIQVHQINEIIFCAQDISSGDIINYMLALVSSGVDFKIASPDSLSIIGSNHIDTAGDLYMIDVNSIAKPENQRKKRLLDVAVSLLVLLSSPVLFWLQERRARFFANSFAVLFGFYSWVGYGKASDKSLPSIKRPVLSPDMLSSTPLDAEKIKLLNLRYAKDYRPEKDLAIIWKCLRKLGY